MKSRAKNDKYGNAHWNCVCDCGKLTTVRGSSLRSGYIKSCGCSRTTHGMTGTPTYTSWDHMKRRCYNQNDPNYSDYGGRGIKVCDSWLKFESFYKDMGNIPEGLTIGRTDNNKSYCPDNCKWVTRKEQSRNTRSNRTIKHQGKTQCLSAWAEELKIDRTTLAYRLKRHPPQIAFNV